MTLLAYLTLLYITIYQWLILTVGLAYAHSKNIIHKDLKPENVVVDEQQMKLRIVDWGLANYYYRSKDMLMLLMIAMMMIALMMTASIDNEFITV